VRSLWTAGGAAALGTGIWSMHFVGMLALELPVAMTYQPGLVLLSVVVAIAVSAFALVIIAKDVVRWPQLALAALAMGLAIATMHYVGMAALRVDANSSYDPRMIAYSVGIAIAASFVAPAIARHFRESETRRVKLGPGAAAGG